MATDEPNVSTDQVIANMKELGRDAACVERCTEQYRRDLEACDGDRDCIHRATGRYVLCVFSCEDVI